MNKKALTETDIRTKSITPAIAGADGTKWDVMTQVREEVYFTKGRVIVRGKTVKRGEEKKADYLLYDNTRRLHSPLNYKSPLSSSQKSLALTKSSSGQKRAGMPSSLSHHVMYATFVLPPLAEQRRIVAKVGALETRLGTARSTAAAIAELTTT